MKMHAKKKIHAIVPYDRVFYRENFKQGACRDCRQRVVLIVKYKIAGVNLEAHALLYWLGTGYCIG